MNLEETLNDLMNNVKISMIQSGGDPNSFGFDKFKENFSNSIKKTMNTSQNSQSQFSNDNVSFSPMDTTNTAEVSQKKMSMWFIFKIVLGLVIFIILAFNIFTYFKTGSDAFTYYIGSLFSKGTNAVKNVFNKGVNSNDTISSDDIHSSLDLSAKQFSEKEENDNSKLKDVVEKGIVGNKSDDDKQDSNYFEDEKEEDEKDGDEDNENKLVNVEKEEDEEETDPEKKYGKNYKASSLLDLKLTKTPGYCYVGTDRNVRTCVKVNIGNKCASGKVFPTMDLCVNPNLKE
tara:strand:- start:53 stop:916 length:864 start_codon:yes stop_codon:yes gene_type:complete